MKLGIIGLGQMGQAICQGLIKAKALSPSDIVAGGRNLEKLRDNCTRLNIKAVADTANLVEQSDWVLLSVKPYQAAEVLRPLKEKLKGKVLISVLSGVDEATLSSYLSPETEIICALPNTPCAVGKGIWVYTPSSSIRDKNEALFYQVFGQTGVIEKLTGAAAEAAGSIAGCGPAFAAMFLEALGDAGVRYGLPREQAYQISAAMLRGLAELYLETNTHPGQLKDQVCSPGGTTIRGVQALDHTNFRASIAAAIKAVMEN